MDINLDSYEARVIGCLIEKAVTTPEQYPLSLNALVTACNQKSNREPVMALGEFQVQQVVDELIKRHLVSEKSGFGSRVVKYQHRLCNSEFGGLQLSEQELGILCVMLLRGPQTPGELRSRTQRLCKFGDVAEVESVLEGLMNREDGPFVQRLARQPGRRESRYAHLFSGEVEDVEVEVAEPVAAAAPGPDSERLARLEQEVAELRQTVERLEQRLQQIEV